MSDLKVSQSSQFFIRELTIVTKSGNIDVKKSFDEINIFDSLFLPVINGTILITDSIGLSNKLLFDGSESILIEIGKDEDSDIVMYKKAFRIYKQTDRKNRNQNSESYILHFVSDELLFSDQQRITQSYNGTYSEIVERIMFDYLKVPKNNLGGLYDQTYGLKKLVVPNLKPLEAIEWCTKRSLNEKQSPNYLFFQNVSGYNFVSLSRLLTLPEIIDLKFESKNLPDQDSIDEMSGVKYFEVVKQEDSIEKIRSGINAGKFIGFDPITRGIATRAISFLDVYSTMDHANKQPNISEIKNKDGLSNLESYDSKKTVSIFGTARKYSEYIKAKDPTSLTFIENYEDILFQRKAIINHLMSKRLKLVMAGNFQLSSGFNVNVTIPEMARKEKNTTDEDLTLSGKHLIVGSRHIIGFEKHETVIEVASTSTNKDFISSSGSNESSAISGY